MTTQYPPTFVEQNLAGDIHIRPEDIADYGQPPGEYRRYTKAGWQKAIAIGVAVLQEVNVAPHLDWHDVGCVKRYGAESDQPCACERRRAESSQDQPT